MELIKQIDETVSFNEKNIRIIGTCQEPWFVAKDICNILELKNITEALKMIPECSRSSVKLNTFGGEQMMSIIDESGLYRLIMRSNKPVAQKFQDVVCKEILPTIRKTGEFKLQKMLEEREKERKEYQQLLEDKEREKQEILQEKDKEIQFKEYQLKKSDIKNKKLESKLEKKKRARYEQSHSVYIISNPSINGVCEKTGNKKNYFKLGKSSNRTGRLSNYGSGAPLDYNINYSRKLSSKREETAIENLMIIIFDNYRCINEIKQKREWLENIDGDVLKKELDVIIDFMESRKKLYDFDRTEYCISESENEENMIDVEDRNEEIEKKHITKKVSHSISLPAPKISLPAPSISFDDDTILVDDDEIPISIPEPVIIPSDEKEMNFENITKRNVELNPRDFDKFVRDCCDVGEDLFTPKGDLRNAYRIWSNCTMKDVVKDFDTYLNTTFKSGAQFIDNSRRNVFRGVKLNDLQFSPSIQNLDYEKFITERCSVHYDNRISYSDFYSLFEEYKQETNPEYKMSKNRQKEIKKYLTHKFIEGRVYISTQEKSGGLFGVYGLGHISNNFGLKEVIRKTMKVGVYNSTTNELIESFDSTLFASHKLQIPFSTLGNHIRLGKIIDNKIFKFIENL
jgi:prophage antirepressor-like protein